MTPKKEVSLLPESENPNSFNAKLLRWLTTTGRIAIIVTELLVVGAFISRFWLDRKNADLSELIRQQQSILNTTENFEKEFISMQQRLNIIRDSYKNEPDYDQKITSITSSTPQDIIYNTLLLKKDEETKKISASLSLTAYKEESIVDFITNLTLNPDISTVKINRIEKKPQQNNYEISILLTFNSDQNKT
jgi:hypothetical protein